MTDCGTQPTYAATLASVQEAATRLAPHIHTTSVHTCTTLDQISGRKLFFKCEVWQKGGSFKFRGACNAVFSLLDDDAAKGVVTHSSGASFEQSISWHRE